MEDLNKRRVKVIWVHLIFEKKNFFFGSVTAIYKELTERQVGITMGALLHRTEKTVMTSRAMITKDYLRR